MKLTESQAESFELLHASICNSVLYAEDLFKHSKMKEPIGPVLIKLRWIKTVMEMRLSDKKEAREKDHLFYDELLRCATHMDDVQKKKLEKFINSL